jgi:hypothetical protein
MLRRLTMLSLLAFLMVQASAVAALTAPATGGEARSAPLLGMASTAEPGVCDGVPGCRVVARVDVDGDGRRDSVGVARPGGDTGRRVVVRVRTGPDHIVSVRAPAEFWPGSPWLGAAQLDGRPGAELVVAYTQGAHTDFFRALTWRAGRLVTLGAPGPGDFWVVDSAAFVSLGWQRLPHDPPGAIRGLSAQRAGTSAHDPFRGTVTRYQWTPRGWRTEASRTVFPMSERAAYAWAGFHVPGLPRW